MFCNTSHVMILIITFLSIKARVNMARHTDILILCRTAVVLQSVNEGKILVLRKNYKNAMFYFSNFFFLA